MLAYDFVHFSYEFMITIKNVIFELDFKFTIKQDNLP